MCIHAFTAGLLDVCASLKAGGFVLSGIGNCDRLRRFASGFSQQGVLGILQADMLRGRILACLVARHLAVPETF